jgi:type IV pilus assembly protein PilB
MARLGDILVDRGFISAAQLETALTAQGSERGMLGRILVRRGLITMEQLGDALSQQFGVPFIDIVPQSVNPQVPLAAARCNWRW